MRRLERRPPDEWTALEAFHFLGSLAAAILGLVLMAFVHPTGGVVMVLALAWYASTVMFEPDA